MAGRVYPGAEHRRLLRVPAVQAVNGAGPFISLLWQESASSVRVGRFPCQVAAAGMDLADPVQRGRPWNRPRKPTPEAD